LHFSRGKRPVVFSSGGSPLPFQIFPCKLLPPGRFIWARPPSHSLERFSPAVKFPSFCARLPSCGPLILVFRKLFSSPFAFPFLFLFFRIFFSLFWGRRFEVIGAFPLCQTRPCANLVPVPFVYSWSPPPNRDSADPVSCSLGKLLSKLLRVLQHFCLRPPFFPFNPLSFEVGFSSHGPRVPFLDPPRSLSPPPLNDFYPQ